MKKLMMVMVGSILSAALPLAAETETVNGITWTYQVCDGCAMLSNFGGSSGEGYDIYNPVISTTTTGAITIPSTLGGYPVTSIGVLAFSDCNGLTDVTIPNSVTNIGMSAFWGCSGLTSMTVPNSVASIGKNAFNCCEGLTSITLPNSVTSIGKDAFSGCNGLREITVPQCVCANALSSIFPSSYQSITNILILDTVTSIGNSAFSDCIGLTSVVIPNSVKNIGWNAFSECTNLTSITIPESVTSMGHEVLWGCYNLTNLIVLAGTISDYAFANLDPAEDGKEIPLTVTIGNSVTNIAQSAFSLSDRLTSVTIPKSVKSIGFMAFSGCENLTNIVVHAGTIGSNAFMDCGRLAWEVQKIPLTLTIGNTVTTIEDSAFSECLGIRDLTIPANVSTIGHFAFNGTGVTNLMIDTEHAYSIGSFRAYAPLTVVLGDNVKHVDDGFLSWRSIDSLTLGKNVETIGESAFSECWGLKDVKIPDSVRDIGAYAFACDGSAFETASPLTNVTFGCGVTNIGTFAFGGGGYTKLGRVEFLGQSAPNISNKAFYNNYGQSGTVPRLDIYIVRGATGWGCEVPGEWRSNMYLNYLDGVMPYLEGESAVDVQHAITLAGFADGEVADVIGGSPTEYSAFKTWAGKVKGSGSASTMEAGEAAVIANTNAAAAFLLGAERLFENAPKIEIGEVAVGEQDGGTVLGVAVTVKDGTDAVRCAAEKVKDMFEVTGDLGDWYGAAKLMPTVTTEASDGATMYFSVKPGDGTSPRAFLRIRK